MNKLLETVLRGAILIGICALPFIVFIVSTSLFFPFITGKNFTFRVIVEIITALWLALAFISPEYRPRRTWLFMAFSVFVAVVAVANAQGAYPFKSFWSNFERMDGWVTLVHLYMLFLVATSVLATERMWKVLFHISLGVSVFVGIYGLMQTAGLLALGQASGQGLQARIDSTFGNSIYLAVYMLFHVFIAGMLWIDSYRKRGTHLWPMLVYGPIIALDTIVLFLTGTRGTILGLLGGVILSTLLLIVFAGNSKNVWRYAVGGLVAILLASGFVYSQCGAGWAKQIGFVQRICTISPTDNTTKARFYNWQIAMKGVAERPLLGWGQENYALVFDKYYDPRMYAQEPWFDRVHNIVFDWLVAAGIIGLLSYLSILVAAVYMMWKSEAFPIGERALLTGLIAGYFFHNLFVFDNVTSYIIFTLVLAYIAWRVGTHDDVKPVLEHQSVEKGLLPFLSIGSVGLAALLVLAINGLAYTQNKALLQALAPQAGGVTANIANMEKALSYNAFGTQEAREQLAQLAGQVAQNQQIPMDVKNKMYNLAVNEMTKMEAASPLDARFPLFLGVIHASFGNAQMAYDAFTQALKDSPTKQSIMYQVAATAKALGKTDEYVALFKKAYEELPANEDARIYYAAALIETKQDAMAQEILQPVIAEKGTDQRIIAAYAARGEYAKIAALFEVKATAHPEDMQASVTWAAALAKSGNVSKAISVLEGLKARSGNNPDVVKQVNEFETQIRSGKI